MATPQQARYSNPPRITYVETGPDADDMPPSQQTARSTGVPVNYTKPSMVPSRTETRSTGPMGEPTVRTTIRSFTQALAQWPHSTMWVKDIHDGIAAIRKNWRADAAADPEIGGSRHAGTLSRARGAYRAVWPREWFGAAR
jgi:hypothetical protein